MTVVPAPPDWAHPDPNKKLFGFHVTFANGTDDYGLVVAPDRATAIAMLENDTFACYAVDLIVDDQKAFVEMLLARYHGLAYLARTTHCN